MLCIQCILLSRVLGLSANDSSDATFIQLHGLALYTRYPIVALGLPAFRPSASREQRYLAYIQGLACTNIKILATITLFR